MLNLCTVADSTFLLKFLALRESIRQYTKNYRLNLLCLDNEIYNTIIAEDFGDIKCFKLKTLLEEDEQLAKSQENEPSFEAKNVSRDDLDQAKKIQFIWSLASYFSWYCLKNENLEDIFYIDSDIYFFEDPTALTWISNFGSIGLIENRTQYNSVNGKYNVGIIYFKNDEEGLACLEFWKNCLMNPQNEYAKEYGSCGDQKYLELFPKLYKKTFQIDDYVGHLAPWNLENHKYIPGKIIYNDKIQDLLFYHFSNFNYNFDFGSYEIAPRHGVYSLENNMFVSLLYETYYMCLENLNEAYIRNDSL